MYTPTATFFLFFIYNENGKKNTSEDSNDFTGVCDFFTEKMQKNK